MSLNLQTERLTLRDVRLDDASAICAYAAAAPYHRYLPGEPPTLDQTSARIEVFLRRSTEKAAPRRHFLIGELPGCAAVVGELTIAQTSTHVAEIGWGIARPYWARGFGTEIARRGLEFGFDELGVHRIEARVMPENTRSVRILAKLGFTFEGVSRECVRARGRWRSLARYGLLAPEFAGAAG